MLFFSFIIVYIDPSISTDQNHLQEHKDSKCFVCWNPLSDSTYLSPDCGFCIHKKCAELALETQQPFHLEKPLFLQFNSELLPCHICKEIQKRGLVYCGDSPDDQICLHIECPRHPKLLFSLLNSAYLTLGFGLLKKYLPLEIKHSFHLQHSLILQFNAGLRPCQICREITQPWRLVYCCSPCNFVIHIKCPKIPSKIRHHPCHPKHPFLRQINYERLPCQSCLETDPNESVYCCPTCQIAFHIGCIAPPPVIEDDKGHEHSFALCWRQLPFVCNACGNEGKCVSYICSMRGFIVHESCTSLPPFIDLPRHDHRLHHAYFLPEDHHQFKTRNCRICKIEVDTRYGSYSCPSSNCNYVCHVNCAMKDYNWYSFDEPMALTTDDDQSFGSIISFTKVGKDQISHSSHQHNLVLREDNVDGKLCEACISLIISAPYYHCSNCDFFLHKSCAELPKKKKLWFHRHQIPLALISDSVFICGVCEFECSGFAYKCAHPSCGNTCLRCASTDPDTSQVHNHEISFYDRKEGECNACGEKLMVGYLCNVCNFAVHDKCLKLPQIAEHKCDEHLLQLITHRDGNNYVHHNHCDICEETRNPNLWFYRCEICDTSAHPKCVLGKYPFIKRGSRYNDGYHQHRPLVFVQKDYDHPQCHKCRKPCVDLALERAETGCDYIVHWECIKPSPENIKWQQIEVVEDPEIDSFFGWLFYYFWSWAKSLRPTLIVMFFIHLILVIPWWICFLVWYILQY